MRLHDRERFANIARIVATASLCQKTVAVKSCQDTAVRFIVSSMMDFIMVRCGCYIMILTGVQPVFGCIQQQRPRQPHWRLPFFLFIFASSRSLCHSLSRFVPSLASPAPSMAPRRLPKGKSGLRRLPNPQTGSRRLPKSQTGPKDTVKNPKRSKRLPQPQNAKWDPQKIIERH